MSKIRIMGTYVPGNKRFIFALSCYVKGIGRARAITISEDLGFDPGVKFQDLDYSDIVRIEKFVKEKGYLIGSDLSRDVQKNIKLQKQIKSYRGLRHLKSLPVRGQRTKTNARTRIGRRKTVANKKK